MDETQTQTQTQTQVDEKILKKRLYNKNRYNKIKNKVENINKIILNNDNLTKVEEKTKSNNSVSSVVAEDDVESVSTEEFNMDDIIKLVDDRIQLYLKNSVSISHNDIDKVITEQKLDKTNFFLNPEKMTNLIQTIMIALLPIVLRMLSNQFIKKEEPQKKNSIQYIMD